MMRSVAEGWWCENCEFFEDENDIDLQDDACTSCGHAARDHIPVEIITEGLS